MFTTFKTAAFIATAVVAAHAVIGTSSAVSLQKDADRAVMPVVKAERIEVRPMQVVKADPIVVHAKKLQVVKAERIEIVAKAA
jgi:hypothetical protein